jgi:PAS domain S-box-containing protein
MSRLDDRLAPGSILDAVLETCRSFVFICGEEGEIGYSNPAAVRLFGRTDSAFERDGFFDMATTRKDRRLLRRSAAALKRNERARLEMVLHSADGLYVPSYIVLWGLQDAEGTERRFLVIGDPMEAMAGTSFVSSIASNNMVLRMLHGCVDPVFLINPATRIVRDCNAAAAAMFGWSRKEFIGDDLRKLYDREEDFLAIGGRLPELESISGMHEEEVLLQGRGGGRISCKLTTLCIFGPEGEPELRVAILHDVTEAQVREELLARLAAKTTELAAELARLTKHQVPIGKGPLLSLGFTDRQSQLVRYAAIGLTTKEMAFRLGISESTVKNHFSAMFRKFGIASRIELIGLLSDHRAVPR